METLDKKSHVEFVSYDGVFPNLCHGTLILKVDEKEYVFNYSPDTDEYKQFWFSYGYMEGNNEDGFYAVQNPWGFDETVLPEELQEYHKEIEEIFNENVEHGCCGGCI